MQQLGVFASKLPEMISMVGFSSELGKELTNIMSKLAKHMPSGGNDPTSERNVLNRMQQTNAQNMQQVQQAKPQAPQGGAPPGGPPSMPMGAAA